MSVVISKSWCFAGTTMLETILISKENVITGNAVHNLQRHNTFQELTDDGH